MARGDRRRQGHGSLEDFTQADVIFIIGQNPGTNHPRMMTTLPRRAARLQIVAINPLPEAGLIRVPPPA